MTVFVLNRIENERARAAVGQRYWTPLLRVEPGNATPGRGGRRKRARRWRFGITDNFVMALAEYDPPVLGYRERRRRAKLRRRRARSADRTRERDHSVGFGYYGLD